MPPPKKAATKAAKKAARKSAGQRLDMDHDKPHHKHHQANALRRSFEHMGRVAVLQQNTKCSSTEAVAELTTLAQQAIKDGHNKDAADLLRASEHLSFAALAGEASGVIRISAELKRSITEHFDELTGKADEHWVEKEGHSNTLAEIYQSSRKSATKAFKARAYHEALEYARAAEALAHVKQHGPLKLERGDKNLQLTRA